MNKKNLKQIFANYIDHFEELNDPEHNENFKWWAAEQFRKRMDLALSKDGPEFADVMKSLVKDKITQTIIDNYTQPFAGLAELARREPETVKKMLVALYADDGGNLEIREQKIQDFFVQSQKLLDRYFPNSFRYKQDAHAVSAYLFLYDPDHHYLYKPTQARLFADCVEFYGDWGSGNNIKLNVFYRMCDELVSEIKNCPELLETSQSRYDRRICAKPENLHRDEEKHILAFDIIYCSMVYDLFRGITFKTITVKEKRLYEERLKKAQELQEEYLDAEERCRQLNEAAQHYNSILIPGVKVWHRYNGEGTILDRDHGNITVQFAERVMKLDFYQTVADGHLKFEDSLEDAKKQQYKELCKNHANIQDSVSRLEDQLKEYRDILE